MNYGARPMRSTRRLSNSLGQRPAWYHIANSVAGVPTQVSIYDEIGFFGVAAGEFMADLKGINGDIELHINSPGGDVHDGIAIYNQLKQRTGSIAVVIDGLAASAASFIAQAASPGRLQVAPHAQMMVHNGFSMAIGDANDLRKTADLLDMITTEIASIYAERSGKPVDFWLAQMAAETWYTDQKAVDTGLADSILGQDAPAKADWDLSVYNAGAPKNCPACGKYNASGAEKCSTCGKPMTGDATEPEPGDGAPQDKGGTGARNADGPADLGDGWVCDPDGQVRYDPDGDGDDDSQASSDTDHDYWDADGNSIKAVPPKPRTDVQEPVPTKPGASDRSLFPVLNADVDSSEWDAGKAWKAGAASDDPAAFYKGICAGRKAGDPSVQSSWALPYKYSPSSAPNAAGVRNALARIAADRGAHEQARGASAARTAHEVDQPGLRAVREGHQPGRGRVGVHPAAGHRGRERVGRDRRAGARCGINRPGGVLPGHLCRAPHGRPFHPAGVGAAVQVRAGQPAERRGCPCGARGTAVSHPRQPGRGARRARQGNESHQPGHGSRTTRSTPSC